MSIFRRRLFSLVNYKKRYLNITATSNEGATIQRGGTNTEPVYYTKDPDSNEWLNFDSNTTINLTKDGIVYFKGDIGGTTVSDRYSSYMQFVISGGYVRANGNVMSLVHNRTFDTSSPNGYYILQKLFLDCDTLLKGPDLPATSLTPGCYKKMFSGCTSLETAPELPALEVPGEAYQTMFSSCSDLVIPPDLPATTLGNFCYAYMFDECNSLNNSPVLPATNVPAFAYNQMFRESGIKSVFSIRAKTLEANACKEMFQGCTSLRQVSGTLNFTSVGNYACSNMFKGCINLTNITLNINQSVENYGCQSMFEGCTGLQTPYISLLPKTLSNYCYFNMFHDCRALTLAPELPATTLAPYCYESMFEACSSLVNGPTVIPANTATNSCCSSMFLSCGSLEIAPELPATTLATDCYYNMFSGCESLKIAPELPAETLVTRCYGNMFSGCENINYIKALFLTEPNDNYTQNWVFGVAEQGTFVKDPDATWNVVGFNGVPIDWTIQNDPFEAKWLTFTPLEDGTFSFTNSGLSYSINGGSWTELQANASTPVVHAGEQIIWKGTITPVQDGGIGTFTSTGKFNVEGNIMSLLYGAAFDNNQQNLSSKDYAFYGLFKTDNTNVGITECKVVNAQNLILPSTTLSKYCYAYMFSRCYTLVTPPEIRATSLNEYSCAYMFEICINLAKTPSLLATSLLKGACEGMFMECSYITIAPDLRPTVLYSECYKMMFKDCINLKRASKIYATNISSSITELSCCRMYEGCTSLTEVPDLPNIDLTRTRGCFYGMFGTCTSLVTAPTLNSQVLGQECYRRMFVDCTSLISPPSLPVTTLVCNCYQEMFAGCTNLITAPSLPATTLADYCYTAMFKNCTNLTTIPNLKNTTLYPHCYEQMFYNCTNLVTVIQSQFPELFNNNVANQCYSEMFAECINLTNIPKIVVNTITSNTGGYRCFYGMFKNCKNLTSVPEINIATINDGASECFRSMFEGCSSLNYIKIIVNEILCMVPLTCAQDWIKGVASSGTLVKSFLLSFSNIPEDWTIKNV